MTSAPSPPHTCLVCPGTVKSFMNFGDMPIANGFLAPSQFAAERFSPLRVGLCGTCGMVQLINPLDRSALFHAEYPFFSSTSQRMVQHFGEFARRVISDYSLTRHSFVIEIGSNDGTMLQSFSTAGIRHLGVEPSASVATMARTKGLETVCAFFDEALAEHILEKYGPADVIIGANVLCHISALPSVIAGMELLLKPGGVVICEDPYLGDIIKKTSYDQMYDEHVFYFSLSSLSRMFEQYGLALIDVAHQDVHGGSMRYTFGRPDIYPASWAVAEWAGIESSLGLDQYETYEDFCRHVQDSRRALMQLLRCLQRQQKRLVGYAATSKSTTVMNYCGITPDLIEYISDTTPLKQGKYSPGVHIPIRPHEDFAAWYPDYALLFAWNHAEEIMAKEQAFKAAGGKWITYVPRVQVVE